MFGIALFLMLGCIGLCVMGLISFVGGRPGKEVFWFLVFGFLCGFLLLNLKNIFTY